VRYYDRRRKQTEPLLGDHLLDLVWAAGILSTIQRVQSVPRLHARIQDLMPDCGEKEIHACFRAMACGCWDAQHAGPVSPLQREGQLLRCLGVHDPESALNNPIALDAEPWWIDLVADLQAWLRSDLARRPITIESNPTSNLLIGGYRDYRELPYRTLVDADLPVSLNTDDPGIFVTSLPGELAAMYGALIDDSSHRQATAWLAERLADAERSTFLGAHVPTRAQIARSKPSDYLRPRS
jgi:hypothetical protein